MPLPVPARLGLGGTLSLLASSASEAMSTGRLLAGRLPDERAITDLLFLAIAGSVSGSRALVDLRSRERRTGADALLVVRYASGAVSSYAAQAKVLASHIQGRPQEPAPTPHYPELGHVSQGGVRQYDQLLAACAPGGALAGWVPIHLFYNELIAGVSAAAWSCPSVFPGDPTEFGVTFARTEDVKVIADSRLALTLRGGGRARFPLALVAPCCRPWLCLLCADRDGACANTGGRWPPRPTLSRKAAFNDEGAKPDDEFEPAPWPEDADEPSQLSWRDGGLAAALLALTGPEISDGLVVEVREQVRKVARTALVIDLAATEHDR